MIIEKANNCCIEYYVLDCQKSITWNAFKHWCLRTVQKCTLPGLAFTSDRSNGLTSFSVRKTTVSIINKNSLWFYKRKMRFAAESVMLVLSKCDTIQCSSNVYKKKNAQFTEYLSSPYLHLHAHDV